MLRNDIKDLNERDRKKKEQKGQWFRPGDGETDGGSAGWIVLVFINCTNKREVQIEECISIFKNESYLLESIPPVMNVINLF